jgi:glucose/arabinose dehydrogenase
MAVAPAQAVEFTRTQIRDIPFPTAIARAPDGRIFITEMMGGIHAVRLSPAGRVLSHQVFRPIGTRLTLGLAVDPLSTRKNTILWVSHSHPNLDHDAPPDTGVVTRLSGPRFRFRRNVITGLPRSAHNHSTNQIHFGPRGGLLYIAQGGNTGAGAAFEGDREFPGMRREQPLGAALLVANVRARRFDGSCHNPASIYGRPPCHVRPYATGFRNLYDFTFHSNGRVYGADNGLGLEGSYPPRPTPPCAQPGDPARFDPGQQPDYLYRIVRGRYYGHPNPSRGQCVWGDGSKQGVSTPPGYLGPISNLGPHRSANGIVEYRARGFGLLGDLLIVNWANGDNITRVDLSPNGLGVVSSSTLPVPRFPGEGADFMNPLAIARGPNGSLYVAEHGGNRVSVLLPR